MARDFAPIFAAAAIFAITASYLWLRFLNVRALELTKDFPLSWQWLTEAVGATAMSLGLAGSGYILSLIL